MSSTKVLILLLEYGFFCHDQVRWARAFYDDFDTFTRDQELLLSMPDLVDYLEGFIVPNQLSLLGTSIAFPAHLGFVPEFHKVYYCIEFAVHDFQAKGTNAEQVSGAPINPLP